MSGKEISLELTEEQQVAWSEIASNDGVSLEEFIVSACEERAKSFTNESSPVRLILKMVEAQGAHHEEVLSDYKTIDLNNPELERELAPDGHGYRVVGAELLDPEGATERMIDENAKARNGILDWPSY